jgi:hypothetical protein
MRWVTFFTMCVMMFSASASAQEFSPVGSFDNVRESTGDEPHCYGWSLALWQYKDRVFGLLDHHEGLCGDPPCHALTDVSHDPKSGRLSFSAFDKRFMGTLTREEVAGTLGSERLHLKRNDNQMDARWDKQLDAWCDFWQGVPRCKGVAKLCRSVVVSER